MAMTLEQTTGEALFLAEIERALQRIQSHPAQWQRANHGTRRILLNRFPHTVYYRELSEAVWIVAVAPQHRRPFYWRERLNTLGKPPHG